MNILLLSSDERLAEFCREILAETFGVESRLDVGCSSRIPASEDVCLWDFIPGETVLPDDLDPARLRKHLFLVDRQHLPVLEELVGTTNINVLLKPVTPATMRAFLSNAHRQESLDNSNSAGSIDTLRLERD